MKTEHYYESKFVIKMIKELIANHSLDYLDYKDLLVMNVPFDKNSAGIEIYSLDATIVGYTKKYYVIEVYEGFHFLDEEQMYKAVMHILLHIPTYYKKENIKLEHESEVFIKEINAYDFKR